MLQRLAGEDAEDARKSSGTATRRRVGFERVFDRLLGREDEPRATAEGVRASVVGNLLKNPWWAVKAGTKGQAAGTAAKAATGNLGKVAAGQAGKSALTGAAGKAAALSGAVAQIPTLGVEGEAASGVVDAVASLIGDGGASATSAGAAGKAAGGGTAAAGKAASAAAAAGGKAAVTGAALKAGAAVAVASAGAFAGYSSLPDCVPEDYAAIRAAAEATEGVVESVAAAAAVAADVPVCVVDGDEISNLVEDGLNAIGFDPSGAAADLASFFNVAADEEQWGER